MSVKFEFEGLRNFGACIYREWVMTNGIGGYAGSTIIGAHHRTHQGYLVASLHPPVERYLVFSKTNEKITAGSRIFDLTTAQHKGEAGTETNIGNQFLKRFTYDGTVKFYYDCGNVRLTKEMTLVHGENTCYIHYIVENVGSAARLTITPLMNYKEHSASQTVENLMTEIPLESINGLPESETNKTVGFYYSPQSNKKVRVAVALSEGTMLARRSLYDENMLLQFEVDNETEGLDCHFTPIDFVVDIPAGGVKELTLCCKLLKTSKKEPQIALLPETGAEFIETEHLRLDGLIERAGFKDDDFAGSLVMAADQFLVNRKSTGLCTVMAGYPWFTDWGRDTMIAFTGLTLETKRFDEAREILSTFAKYIKNGLVPNMFPDDGQAPLYNTVDASLWYFYAVYNYLKYVDTDEAWDFVEKEIYPGLMAILSAYRKGTDFSIGMDEDGLLHAGSGLDQVTWMDVRVGDWVATPRHGKPVEINALWYNAIMSMEEISRGLAKREHEKTQKAADYLAYAAGLNELAVWIKDSFIKEFWYEEGGYLYDVVDRDFHDKTLRPNQIYAVSLPFTMLPSDMEKSIVKVVEERLFVEVGLRSLDRDDSEYHPIYLGSLDKRDHAYHQGTAWGFLLGGFFSAYLKVRGNTPEAKQDVDKMMDAIRNHLNYNCIGSINEIFDGDEPHLGRGCYAQAWSVGEILRAYAQIKKN